MSYCNLSSKGKYLLLAAIVFTSMMSHGQETDISLTPNTAGAGGFKSYEQQIGKDRGDNVTLDSSACVIERDPFRAIARGRQLFQRKFTGFQGVGPRVGDGVGDLGLDARVAAGLSDSCAACHGRPKGSAGFGGNVFTRPDSRDAPHLFGLGLVEMLGDEMTTDLRAIRDAAVTKAKSTRRSVTTDLLTKGVSFGSITVASNGTVDNRRIKGVDADLRVKPFFAEGSVFSIRAFSVGAFHAEMGMQACDPDLKAAAAGGRVVTPSGLVLDGSKDKFSAPPAEDATSDADGDGVKNEVPQGIVDFMEFYLLNYFKPGTHQQGATERNGSTLLRSIGCTECHVANLTIKRDRRVADVETVFDPQRGGFNRLFATATPLYNEVDDGHGMPTLKQPKNGQFVVRNIYSDLKRHDLGPNFNERKHDGTITTQFVTEPLWGVGSTSPYGHDGRSISLEEVILRHGGEAKASRDRFRNLDRGSQMSIILFLNSLVLFPPPDTASNLNPANPATPGYPQFGHGSIALSVLFNDPTDKE